MHCRVMKAVAWFVGTGMGTALQNDKGQNLTLID